MLRANLYLFERRKACSYKQILVGVKGLARPPHFVCRDCAQNVTISVRLRFQNLLIFKPGGFRPNTTTQKLKPG